MLILTCNVTDMFQSQHVKRQRNSGAYLLIAMVSCCFHTGDNKLRLTYLHDSLCSHKDYELYYIT